MRFIAILIVGLMLATGAVRAEEAKDAPLSSSSEAVGQQITPMLDTGGHTALIRDIAFTPDGRQLVSAGYDKVIRVWDVATGKTVRTIRGEATLGQAGKIFAIALSPDGKWLAAGGWLSIFTGENYQNVGIIRLYDFASGRLVALLKGHESVVADLAFSPDGRHLISGSSDSTAIIWDVETKQLKHRLKGHSDEIYAVGFTDDGARAVTGSFDHDLRLWRVSDGSEITQMLGHNGRITSLAVATDDRIASVDDTGEIRLWDGRTGKFLKTLARKGKLLKMIARKKTELSKLSFSPDGRWLLSGMSFLGISGDGHVYDTVNGTESVIYLGHDDIVFATAISPDGRWAATAGSNNSEIHIWNLQTGERCQNADDQPLTLNGSGRPVLAV